MTILRGILTPSPAESFWGLRLPLIKVPFLCAIWVYLVFPGAAATPVVDIAVLIADFSPEVGRHDKTHVYLVL